MTGPPGPPAVAQMLAPGVVLLGPEGVALVVRALETATARAFRDGIGLPPQARQLRDALIAAGSGSGTCSHAHVGTSEPDDGPVRAWSLADVVDVAEVMAMVGCSDGFARRLFRDGAFETGRKVGNRWQAERLEVQAWRSNRQEARTA